MLYESNSGRKCVAILCLATVLCFVKPTAKASQLTGQTVAPQAVRASSDTHVNGVIDGLTNPELIPDSLAFRHFWTVLLTKSGPERDFHERRRRSYVSFFFDPNCNSKAKNKLTEHDISVLLGVADALSSGIEEIEKMREDKFAVGLQTRNSLRESAFTSATADLRSRLSADSFKAIEDHVLMHVKSRVRIVTVRIGE